MEFLNLLCWNLLKFDIFCLHQIDSHVKRLDEDLNHFAEDLKQGTVVCESLVCIIFGRGSEPFNEFFEQEYFSPWMKTMGRDVYRNQSLTELNSFKPYYLLDYS